MKKFLWYLLGLPIAAIIIVLSVTNRHSVTVNLDPFAGETSALSFQIPLFILLFSAFGLGLLAGAGITWFNQGRWRRQARLSRREAARLANQARQAREQDRQPAIAPPSGAANS